MNIKKVSFRKFWDSGDYSSHRKELLLLILVVDINCHVCAGLFSAADRCFPRARLQSPRETHSAGSSDTCYSRRSQRSSAPNNHRNSESELYSTVANRTMLAMEIHVDSSGKAKTMRPHSERSLRVRRLIASPRKA